MKKTRWTIFSIAFSLILLSMACNLPLGELFEGDEAWVEEEETGDEMPTLPPVEIQAQPTSESPLDPADKWSLWTHGTQLRGANIWSRVVVPDLDGTEFLGAEHVGPPYTQEDFNRLAELGANYINLSHPGLFYYYKEIEIGDYNSRPYNGKIVILNNEFTQSSAEFTTMAFRSIPNSIIIGSTTSGADGAISWISLPGGIHTLITGSGVYYPDGSP